MDRRYDHTMTSDSIHVLHWDLPAPPANLARLAALLAESGPDIRDIEELIAADMALAAAVLKTVNSSLFGLSGRVQTVREALMYLGIREVSALTLQHGLRAVFPANPLLDLLWQRAVVRGTVMGLLGRCLGWSPWVAHSAGLFEESGKALLLRNGAERYAQLLVQAGPDTAALLLAEQQAFGVTHDVLGAALCETWGLSPTAVYCVRHHVAVHTRWELPAGAVTQREICALSAVAALVMGESSDIQALTAQLAEQLGIPLYTLLSAVQAAQVHVGKPTS